MRAKNPSVFVQDDIKLRPNLTVNLGVRSETHGGMSEVHNNIGGFDPTLTNPVTNTLGSIWFAGLNGARTQDFETKTKVMPRLGIAWQPTSNWVVRGGVGQYASLWSMDTVGGPLGFGTGITGNATANAAYGAAGCTPARRQWCSFRGLGRACPRLPVAILLPTSPPQRLRETGLYPIPPIISPL